MSDLQRALYARLAQDLREVLYRKSPGIRELDAAARREEEIAESYKRRPARDFRRRPASAYWRGM